MMCDILFITPNLSSAVKHEINGTMLLGTLLLEDGFDVKILRFSEIEGYNTNYPVFIEDFLGKILVRKPRCVSFYSVWTDYHVVLRLCEELRKRDSSIHLVIGGPQGSALAMDTMRAFPSVDFICVGEGENTVVPFFRRMLRGEGADFSEIPGLYFRKDGQIVHNDAPIPLSDLESLPFWDERLLMEEYTDELGRCDPDRYFMPVDAGRGCPYNCVFCSTSGFWHRTYRLKSADRIMADIRYFHDRFGYRSFLLSHDALTANTQLMEQLCDRIMESGLGISWECSTRIDCVTPELILRMKESGMKNIHMGIETGSERMQKLTNKNLDLTRVKSVVKFLLSQGIHIFLFFIYGFPEETEEDLNQTLELTFELLDMGVQDIQLNPCLYSPQTEMTARYFDQLEFDDSLESLVMTKFGCLEEIDMIRNNKSLFTTLYRLKGTLHDVYPYAKHLLPLYMKFPQTARYVRQLYRGDNLRFCRDFQERNGDVVKLSVRSFQEILDRDPLQVMLNTISALDAPHVSLVRELLRFEADVEWIRAAPAGTRCQKTYGFHYYEYKLGCPIDEFSCASSEILMEKQDGKAVIKLVSLR